MVAVTMPSYDLELFSSIIKKDYKKDRYVDKSTNDKEDPLFYVSYGNKNTADFLLSNLNTNKPHGIHIRIYPIRKSIKETVDIEQSLGIRFSIKKSLNKFVRKHMTNKDAFYVRYGLDFLRFIFNLSVNTYSYIKNNYPKAIVKEQLYDIFGRNSWFLDYLITIYRYIYSALDVTYFFFKNLRKHPFIERWEDLKYHDNARIINSELNIDSFDNVDKFNVDGIYVNLPGDEFFQEVFGKNYKKRKVKSKQPRTTAILDTETSYQTILKERKKYINEIKSIQREIRKTRSEVLEETQSVNNVFKLVKMTDLQIKYQRFFDRRRKYLFSLDMENDEQFTELYNRLAPIIKNLRRYSELDMTFSIDEEADELLRNVMLRIGEEELVNKINALSKMKYFVE